MTGLSSDVASDLCGHAHPLLQAVRAEVAVLPTALVWPGRCLPTALQLQNAGRCASAGRPEATRTRIGLRGGMFARDTVAESRPVCSPASGRRAAPWQADREPPAAEYQMAVRAHVLAKILTAFLGQCALHVEQCARSKISNIVRMLMCRTLPDPFPSPESLGKAECAGLCIPSRQGGLAGLAAGLRAGGAQWAVHSSLAAQRVAGRHAVYVHVCTDVRNHIAMISNLGLVAKLFVHRRRQIAGRRVSAAVTGGGGAGCPTIPGRGSQGGRQQEALCVLRPSRSCAPVGVLRAWAAFCASV